MGNEPPSFNLTPNVNGGIERLCDLRKCSYVASAKGVGRKIKHTHCDSYLFPAFIEGYRTNILNNILDDFSWFVFVAPDIDLDFDPFKELPQFLKLVGPQTLKVTPIPEVEIIGANFFQLGSRKADRESERLRIQGREHT